MFCKSRNIRILQQKIGKVEKVEKNGIKIINQKILEDLNDLRHIIYKSADTHWRQSKKI